MSVVSQIHEVVTGLRRRGFKVVFIPGWETRGRGPMRRVLGQVNHYDAVPPSAGHAGGLRVCTYGHGNLRNSLCMFYVASDGVVYVVAAGVSWHAGAGDIAFNPTWSGIECRNNNRGEAPTSALMDSLLALNEESAMAFGFDKSKVIDHKEHAPRRKSDRFGTDPRLWREAMFVADYEEDEMNPAQEMRLIATHETVLRLEERLVAVERELNYTGEKRLNPLARSVRAIGQKLGLEVEGGEVRPG